MSTQVVFLGLFCLFSAVVCFKMGFHCGYYWHDFKAARRAR